MIFLILILTSLSIYGSTALRIPRVAPDASSASRQTVTDPLNGAFISSPAIEKTIYGLVKPHAILHNVPVADIMRDLPMRRDAEDRSSNNEDPEDTDPDTEDEKDDKDVNDHGTADDMEAKDLFPIPYPSHRKRDEQRHKPKHKNEQEENDNDPEEEDEDKPLPPGIVEAGKPCPGTTKAILTMSSDAGCGPITGHPKKMKQAKCYDFKHGFGSYSASLRVYHSHPDLPAEEGCELFIYEDKGCGGAKTNYGMLYEDPGSCKDVAIGNNGGQSAKFLCPGGKKWAENMHEFDGIVAAKPARVSAPTSGPQKTLDPSRSASVVYPTVGHSTRIISPVEEEDEVGSAISTIRRVNGVTTSLPTTVSPVNEEDEFGPDVTTIRRLNGVTISAPTTERGIIGTHTKHTKHTRTSPAISGTPSGITPIPTSAIISGTPVEIIPIPTSDIIPIPTSDLPSQVETRKTITRQEEEMETTTRYFSGESTSWVSSTPPVLTLSSTKGGIRPTTHAHNAKPVTRTVTIIGRPSASATRPTIFETVSISATESADLDTITRTVTIIPRPSTSAPRHTVTDTISISATGTISISISAEPAETVHKTKFIEVDTVYRSGKNKSVQCLTITPSSGPVVTTSFAVDATQESEAAGLEEVEEAPSGFGFLEARSTPHSTFLTLVR